jgi:flagellar protein FlgJ
VDFPNLTGLQLQQAMPQPGQGAPELARRAAKSGDEQTLRKASQEFESIFVHLLLKEMRKGMPTGGVFERSMAREWFEGMMDDAVAKEVSKGPGIGLAGPIFDQMRQLGVKPAVQAGAAAAPAPKDEAPKTEEKKP